VKTALLAGHPDSPHARAILHALNARGLRNIDVVAAQPTAPQRSLGELWRAHGWALPVTGMWWLAGRVRRGIGAGGARPSPESLATRTRMQGGRFVVVEDANGAECQRQLKFLAVELQVLAGAPIIRAPVLAIPRLGTLNGHLGALPRHRGMNTVEWAVFEGAQPAVTVHFVDPGVDTGDVVASEPVPVLAGDTLELLRARASAQQIDLLSRVVAAAAGGPLPRRPQRAEHGRQYFVMHPRLRAVAEVRLRDMARPLSPAVS
jgi:folate-dependent phosphoribosylglycinamide formyltransferase PurN